VPASEQVIHEEQALALPKEYVIPFVQPVLAVPPGHAKPAGQALHCLSRVATHAVDSYVVALQAAVQGVAITPLQCFSVGHDPQMRLVMLVHELVSY